MSEPLLTMRGIVKAFSGVKALDGIDLTVAPGECVGLCGENGAGKSTLMKVLSGVYPHGTWDGEITWEGEPLKAASIRDTERAGIIIIHQELMLVPELSVAENIFLGNEITLPGGRMNYAAMYQRADELLRELGISGINSAQPVMNYGGGHQQLIEIAKALNKRAKLLILDEPSSSLTATEIHILLDIVRDLKRRGVACVYISHKLDEVAAVCDTISVIRDGRHVATEPMRALTTDRIISLMVGREIKNLFPREPHPIGDVIFEARHVTCFDVNNPRRKRVNDVSFTLRRGEILGVAGLVGAGRTELMQAIFGAYPGVSEATVVMDGKPLKIRAPVDAIRAGIGMVPEDRKRHGIVPGLSVGHNITLAVLQRFAKGGRIDSAAELDTIHTEMKRLSVRAAHPMLSIASLSGGNQQKAVLTRMLLTDPKVLILDEPTRGVDVGAKFEIYKLIFQLAQRGMSIVMVSSELPEVLGISDRVLVIGEGELRGDFVNDGLTQEDILSAAIRPVQRSLNPNDQPQRVPHDSRRHFPTRRRRCVARRIRWPAAHSATVRALQDSRVADRRGRDLDFLLLSDARRVRDAAQSVEPAAADVDYRHARVRHGVRDHRGRDRSVGRVVAGFARRCRGDSRCESALANWCHGACGDAAWRACRHVQRMVVDVPACAFVYCRAGWHAGVSRHSARRYWWFDDCAGL